MAPDRRPREEIHLGPKMGGTPPKWFQEPKTPKTPQKKNKRNEKSMRGADGGQHVKPARDARVGAVGGVPRFHGLHIGAAAGIHSLGPAKEQPASSTQVTQKSRILPVAQKKSRILPVAFNGAAFGAPRSTHSSDSMGGV